MLVSFTIQVDSSDIELLDEVAYSAQAILRTSTPLSPAGKPDFTAVINDCSIVFAPSELSEDEYQTCMQNTQEALALLPVEAYIISDIK